jgi:hypothetical protein
VHRHPCGGDHFALVEQLVLALALPVAVCTTMRTTVHRRGVSGATVTFNPRLVKLELEGKGPLVNVTPVTMHHPFSLETG